VPANHSPSGLLVRSEAGKFDRSDSWRVNQSCIKHHFQQLEVARQLTSPLIK
jgi:hypothetical protein